MVGPVRVSSAVPMENVESQHQPNKPTSSVCQSFESSGNILAQPNWERTTETMFKTN